METYYIYHIPGVKIGCTSQLEERMKAQGFSSWEVLETHNDGWVAGNREIELQKQYGYPVDKVHYMISRQNRPTWNNANKRYSSEQARYANSCRKNTKHAAETKNKMAKSKSKLLGLDDLIRNEFKSWDGSRRQFCLKQSELYGVSLSTIGRIILNPNHYAYKGS